MTMTPPSRDEPVARWSTYLFETPRLVARHVEADDVDAMFAVYGDADAMRWVGDGEPLGRDQCEHWVEVTHRNYALRGYGMSALLDRVDGAVIGFCGLVHPGAQPDAEIKYALHRRAWGRGLASEAAAGMMAYAENLGLPRVIATIAPENLASHRVLCKAGLRPTELRRNDDGSLTQCFAWEAGAAKAAEAGRA